MLNANLLLGAKEATDEDDICTRATRPAYCAKKNPMHVHPAVAQSPPSLGKRSVKLQTGHSGSPNGHHFRVCDFKRVEECSLVVRKLANNGQSTRIIQKAHVTRKLEIRTVGGSGVNGEPTFPPVLEPHQILEVAVCEIRTLA
jgi:hypothetical protein